MSTKILLAEDHDSNRAVLKRRLERRGFEVVDAENGEIAAAQFAAQAPDIVLLDLSMPVMDGFDALQLMRASRGAAAVRFVALTAHAMSEMREKCEAAGFDAFLTKPIEFDDLVAVIERLRGPDSNVAA